jgi:hypothetical protein
MGFLPIGLDVGSTVALDQRGKEVPAMVTDLPFI